VKLTCHESCPVSPSCAWVIAIANIIKQWGQYRSSITNHYLSPLTYTYHFPHYLLPPLFSPTWQCIQKACWDCRSMDDHIISLIINNWFDSVSILLPATPNYICFGVCGSTATNHNSFVFLPHSHHLSC
jgi:hypothetical protein